ncbi:sugar fermentation stimulation protein [Patescibacteria group bacterium]|nr:sugar fermentation stimulation protein [Patescibacteria group bacterium]
MEKISFSRRVKFLIFFSLAVLIYGGSLFYSLKNNYFNNSFEYLPGASVPASAVETILPPPPVHIKTPEPVRAIYMTSWVAGTKNWRQDLIKMIDDTELNSVVIDVKDYTGRISFEVSDPVLKELGAEEKRIPDVKNFIEYLHQKNIYVIARISVFQDPYFVKLRPDLAVKRGDGAAWKDYKGIAWIDPCAREYWDYIVRLSKETESVGFDELNYDYIRFPSDGNMKDIVYDFCDSKVSKAENMENFFSHLSQQLEDLEISLSADLFGMTTWNKDDLNIGQVLEKAAPYFDYIAPMVYPSHYPTGFQGYRNPALYPYEIIYSAMKRGSEKLIAASSTPAKLRPWLQDFDLGATYTAEMIKKEKQAVYDAGLTSWMLWDPANRYTRDALEPK